MSKEELYDVVNVDGKPIRIASWQEVHSKGLLHMVVAIFIFKDHVYKELLLQQRSKKMNQDPGLWNHSAGGHMLSGETPDKAMLRELSEELFYRQNLPDLNIQKVITFYNHDFPNNKELCHLFQTTHPGPFSFQNEEVEGELKWMPWCDLLKDIDKNPKNYSVSFKNAIINYRKPLS